MANGPLTGIRVVELSTMITASSAGMMLGDMGADVIKVENPKLRRPVSQLRPEPRLLGPFLLL